MVTSAAHPGRPVVGRGTEVSLLAPFVDSAGTGARALVVEGEAGIGKTTLVHAAVERASSAGLRVLVARPSATETELPHAGLGDLLADTVDDALAMLAVAQRDAMLAALGRARGTADEHALARGVLELLRAWSAGGDLLVVVDDVQWLDRPTALALAFALRRLDALPIRVLVSARREPGDARDVPLGLGEWPDVRRVVLGPMSVTELGAVVRDRLAVQLARPRLRALHRASGGNPMFALELVERGDPGGMDGSTLGGAVAARLRSVDPDARTAISYAAAALRPSVGLLSAAGVRSSQLEAAAAAGLARTSSGIVAFTHPLYASVAYDLLQPDERAEIHGRLAAAGTDVLERGYHISRAVSGPDGASARAVHAAADEAARRGDHAGAAGLFRRAALLTPEHDPDSLAGRELRCAQELEQGGDAEASVALCRSLIDRLGPGSLRAEARLQLTTALFGLSYEDARAELVAALDDAEDNPILEARLHAELADIGCAMCRLDEAVAHARIGYDLAERAGAEDVAVTALSTLGFAESMLGLGVPETLRTANARWDGVIRGASPRMELACACVAATRFDEAETLLRDELAAAQECGIEPIEVVARGHLAEVLTRSGRWAEALEQGRLTLEHALQAADLQIIAAASAVVAMTEALLGQHDSARERATSALASAEQIGDFWWRISSRSVLGLVALTEDDPAGAIELLEPAWTLMLDRRLGDLSLFPVPQVLGEACVAVDRLDEADTIAATLAACAVGGEPWCRAMSLRLAALVASTRGRHDAAQVELAAAIAALDSLPEPFEQARTLYLAGRIERNARRWGAARTALGQALERFDQLGAARWAEKAAADLARLPGRRRADKQALTTREREVAKLVAAGHTNKEVAARLYISVRTVEANLTSTYAKLGIHSRSELILRLGEVASPQDAS